MSKKWVGITLAVTMVVLFVVRIFIIAGHRFHFHLSDSQGPMTALFAVVVSLLAIHAITREEQEGKKGLIKRVLSSLLGLFIVTVAFLIRYCWINSVASFWGGGKYVVMSGERVESLFLDLFFLGSLLLMSNIIIRKKGPDKKTTYLWQIIGSVGSVLVFIGVFCPSYGDVGPDIFGGVEFAFYREGWYVLGLAVISFILALLKQCRWLLATGLTSLSIMVFDFIPLAVEISRQEPPAPSYCDPYGMPLVPPPILELEYGWIVLCIGVTLMIGAGLAGNLLLKRKESSKHDT